MEPVLPPKSEHATYDPPVLAHLGMHPELGPAMRAVTNAFVPWEKAGQP